MKGKVFIAQEVQSILNGSKVMFREVIKPQPIQPEGFSDAYFDCYNKSNQWNWWTKDNKQLLGQIVKCPYQVGQKIFCKESWVLVEDHLDYETGEEWSVREWEGSLEEAQAHIKGDARFGLKASVYYPADGEDENPAEIHDTIGIGGKLLSKKEIPWRSAKSMPQWASRLTLLIKSIGVERLGEISEEDAIKEGLDLDSEHSRLCFNIQDQPYSNDLIDGSAFKTIFANNWNATHKKPEEKFEANHWVWKVGIEVVR